MNNSQTRVLVTVDTEGDDEWSWRPEASTSNGQRIPAFQDFCEGLGFAPTYVVTFDMLQDSEVARTLARIAQRGAGEVGSHLHPWRTPPFDERYDGSLSFPHELPDELLAAKLRVLTETVADVIGSAPRSHRAGRYGLDARQIGYLEALGYTVDSSVTPGINWQPYEGLPGGPGGPDFTNAPLVPYHPSHEHVCRPGNSRLVEVPLSIRIQGSGPAFVRRWYAQRSPNEFGGRVLQRLGLAYRREMRPVFYSTEQMKELARNLVAEGAPAINILLHSSELLPGGSPYHATEDDVRHCLERLEDVLCYCRDHLGLGGATLASFGAPAGGALKLSGDEEG